MSAPQRRRLDSWKVIAEYVGRNARTAMRWADERGLPVRKVPGGKRGTVFAFTDELDEWLLSESTARDEESFSEASKVEDVPGEGYGNGVRDGVRAGTGNSAKYGNGSGAGITAGNGSQETGEGKPLSSSDAGRVWLAKTAGSEGSEVAAVHRSKLMRFQGGRWRWVIVGSLVLAGAIVLWAAIHPLNTRAAQPFSVEAKVDSIEAKDETGRTLWTHSFNKPFSKYMLTLLSGRNSWTRVNDFYHDGKKEVAVIVPLQSGPNPNEGQTTELDLFSSTGSLLWRYEPDETFQFGTHELKAPWYFLDLFVSPSNGQDRLFTVAEHHMWGNSFVLQIEPRTGRDTLRFMNTGALYVLNELKVEKETYLVGGGFNNEWDGGSLVISNESRPFAASPQTPGTRHKCESCPAGEPDYYFVFPRTEINRASGIYQDPVLFVHVTEDGIEVSKHERYQQGGETTVYLLSARPPFSVVSLRYNSEYDMRHREWSKEGKLNHSLENCPERMHPLPVRVWTPVEGWREIEVKAAKADQ